LARAAGFYGVEQAHSHALVLRVWALYLLTNLSSCLITSTSPPMRSYSGRRSKLQHILHIVRFIGNADPHVLMAGFGLKKTLFAHSNLTVNCPQVVLTILFYNENISTLIL
jgi:hypothetical protein